MDPGDVPVSLDLQRVDPGDVFVSLDSQRVDKSQSVETPPPLTPRRITPPDDLLESQTVEIPPPLAPRRIIGLDELLQSQTVETPPPLTPRRSVSLVTVEQVNLKHVFSIPEGVVEFMHILDYKEARYASLYIMVDSFRKLASVETDITSNINDLKRILTQFFYNDDPLDFKDPVGTEQLLTQLMIKMEQEQIIDLDPLIERILEYLGKYLGLFKSTEAFEIFYKEFGHRLVDHEVELEYLTPANGLEQMPDSKEEKLNEENVQGQNDESFKQVLNRERALKKAIEETQADIKRIDEEMAIVDPSEFGQLMENKIKLQKVYEELSELLVIELEQPIDVYVDMSNVTCKVVVDHDTLNLNLFNVNQTYQIYFTDGSNEWMRSADMSDFEQLADAIKEQFIRAESLALPDNLNKKKRLFLFAGKVATFNHQGSSILLFNYFDWVYL